MAISARNAGAWAFAASGSVTTTLPGHSTGDMLLVRVAYKSNTIATCLASTATSGWAKLGEFHDGTTNSGNGTGSVAVAEFWKVATSGAETNPTIDFSTAVTQVGHLGLSFQKGGTDPSWLTPEGAGGPHTGGTSFSAVIGTHIGVKANDMVVAALASRDDTAFTVPTFTQTGVTYAAVTEFPATAGISTVGDDGSYDSCYRLANSGTSSAAAVVTGTLATTETGSAWQTRLRLGGQATFTADAVLFKNTSTSFTANAVLLKNVVGSTPPMVIDPSITSTASGTSLNISLGTQIQADDRLFIEVICPLGSGPTWGTDPSGWSPQQKVNPTGVSVGYYRLFKTAVAADVGASVTVSISSAVQLVASKVGVRRPTLTDVTSSGASTGGSVTSWGATDVVSGAASKYSASFAIGEKLNTAATTFNAPYTSVEVADGVGSIIVAYVWSSIVGTGVPQPGSIGSWTGATTFGKGGWTFRWTATGFTANATIMPKFTADAVIKQEIGYVTYSPIVQRGTQTSNSVTAASAVTVSIPAAAVSGDYLVAIISNVNARAGTSTPAGWFLHHESTTGGMGQQYYHRYHNGTDTDATFSITGGNTDLIGHMTAWTNGTASSINSPGLRVGWSSQNGLAANPVSLANTVSFRDFREIYDLHTFITNTAAAAFNPGSSGATELFELDNGTSLSYAMDSMGLITGGTSTSVAGITINGSIGINGWKAQHFYLISPAMVFRADAFVQPYFRADAVIAGGTSTVNGSFTANAVLFKTISASTTADSVLKKTISGSFAADAVLKKTISASATANAVLFKTVAGSFSADALIVRRVLYDTFSRVVADGLGTADDGTLYQQVGIGATAVDGSAATTVSQGEFQGYEAPTRGLVQFDFYVPADETDDQLFYRIDISSDDPGYTANELLQPVDVFSLGDGTWLAEAGQANYGFTPDPSTWYRIKGWCDAPNTGEAVKVWKVGDAEPDWQDSTSAHPGSGSGPDIPELFFRGTVLNPAKLDNLTIWDASGTDTVFHQLLADAVIKATISGSFSCDAVIMPRFTADAVIASSATVVEGSFTANAITLKTQAASFTANAVILRTISASFTEDAVLLKTATATFTANAVLLRVGSATLTADAVVFKTQTATFAADAVLFKTASVSFSADAVLRIGRTGSLTADAVLLRTQTATLSADAVLFRTITGTFTANAVVMPRFSADAITKATISGAFTANATIMPVFRADAITLKTQAATFSADAFVQGSGVAAFSADAVILRTQSATFTADAIALRTQTGSFTANAVILRTQSQTFAADAILKATITQTFTGNAVILRTGITATFTEDAVLLRTASATFAADAVLLRTQSQTFSADAVIKATVTVTFTQNAVLLRTQSQTFSADAMLLRAASATFSADATILRVQSATLTADAVIFRTITATFAADAVVMPTFTADAITLRTQSASLASNAVIMPVFRANAVLLKTQTATFTAQAWVQGSGVAAITADAILFKSQSAVTTANAVVLRTQSATFTANATILAIGTGVLAANAVLKRTISGSFTENAVLLRTASATFSANAVLKREITGSLTADARIRIITSATFSADAFLLAVRTQTFSANAIAFRITSASITANAVLRVGRSGSFTASAVLLKSTSGSTTGNAVILKSRTDGVTANAVMSSSISGAFTADAELLQGTFISAFTAAALLGPGFSTNAVIQASMAGGFNASAIIVNNPLDGISSALAAAHAQSMLSASHGRSALVAGHATSVLADTGHLTARFSFSTGGTFTSDAVIA